MTNIVTFTTAVLLKEKKFKPTKLFGYISKFYNHNTKTLLAYGRTGKTDLKKAYYAPTITEVIQWLYEEHSLIILTIPTVTGHFAYKIIEVQLDPNNPIERPPYEGVSAEDYNNLWECYEAGIEYILKTII